MTYSRLIIRLETIKSELVIGHETSVILSKRKEEYGSNHDLVKDFYHDVRSYFQEAAYYILEKFPLKDAWISISNSNFDNWDC